MKKHVRMLVMIIITSVCAISAQAQTYEIQCLLLDVQKLTQLKSILDDMKGGYEVLTQGYNAVKDISEGNFNLHKVFLDNLLKVSPAVQNYKKVADIISDQLQLVKEYKNAWKRFSTDPDFSPNELIYISRVYSQLTDESLKKLDDLTAIISEDVLRMNDDERLKMIDGIAEDMRDKLTFLRHFNGKTYLLSLQRSHEQNNVSTLRNTYGIK